MTFVVSFFWALVGSKMARYAFMGLLAWGGYAAWKSHQQGVGAEKATARIEKKANDDAKKADDVRTAVASGARGVRGPYERSGD